jgi:hypothetical protein
MTANQKAPSEGPFVLEVTMVMRYKHKNGKTFNQVKEAMYFDQDGTCAICYEAEATVVDHDHACCKKWNPWHRNCVRGMLCVSCNGKIWYYEAGRSKAPFMWQVMAQRYLNGEHL